MGSVTKKPSPVVIIKKKRRILSHQDDAVQAVPDDIKPAPVMEFKTDSLPPEIPATVAGSPEQQKKTGRKKKKKRRTIDGIMSLSDTVWTVLKKHSLSYGLKRGDIMHLK
ncbi:Uncharacterised protein [Escherichia coli]|nr:hypothetical protein ECOL707_24855 [Escherichia coli]SRZ22242.1 Uncharacterised protein [Escherichia coli]